MIVAFMAAAACNPETVTARPPPCSLAAEESSGNRGCPHGSLLVCHERYDRRDRLIVAARLLVSHPRPGGEEELVSR
jgi:hypothetical protein